MADNFQNNNELILKFFSLFLGYVYRLCNIINVQGVKTLKDKPMRLSFNDSTIIAFRMKTSCLFVAAKFRSLTPAYKTIVIAHCVSCCYVLSIPK